MKIDIYTDGSCKPSNPGPGGYAYIMYINDIRSFTYHARIDYTTNQRMELTAVIEGLIFVKKTYDLHQKLEIVILTDSNYVLKGSTEWIHKWRINNWYSSTGKCISNLDLWHIMNNLLLEFGSMLMFKKVKAHSTNKINNEVDLLAKGIY